MVDLAPGSVAANPPSGSANAAPATRGDGASSPADRSGRPRLRHMPALDGLRGAAVAAVVLFHDAPLWNGDRRGRLVGGYLGVDLFFTLSGFLITSLLVTEWLGTGRISLSNFWSRRARGSCPPCSSCWPPWACTPCGSLPTANWTRCATTAWPPCSTWRTGGPSSAAAGTRSGRRRRPSSTCGAWPSRSSSTSCGRSWCSASSTWPVDARSATAAGRHSSARPGLGLLAFVIVAATLASSVYMAVAHHDVNDVNRVYLGSDARAGSILVGAALAVLVAWRGPVRGRAARVALEVAAIAALAALVFAWATVEYPTPGLFEGGLVLCGLLAVVVIAAAAHPTPGPVARVLAVAPLRGLGLISYGLYLWHWPVFVVLNPDRVGFGGWGLSALRYAAALGIALASYWLVEQPIRRGRLLQGWTARLAPAVAAIAVVVALVVSTADAPSSAGPGSAAGDGTFAPESPPAVAPVAPTTTPAPPSAVDTGPGPGPTTPGGPPTTVAAAPTAPTPSTRPDPSLLSGPAEAAGLFRIMAVGDSVGRSLARGLDVVKDDVAGGSFLDTQAYLGCGLSRGDGEVHLEIPTNPEAENCHSWATRWVGDVARTQPELVIVLYGGWDIADRKLDGEWVHPCLPQFDPWYAGLVDEALTVLGSQGATVAVATLPYIREPRSELFGVGRADVDARVDCLNRIWRAGVERHAADGAVLVDLAAWVCPGTGGDDGCVDRVDGTTLRPDGMHFGTDDNRDAEPIVARWFMDQLASRGLVPAG